ncbi:hypothetical protein Tco_1499108 [Tanacetum coccineum]
MTNNTHTPLKPHLQLENKPPWQSHGVLLDEVDQGLRLVSKKHKWVSKDRISWLGEHHYFGKPVGQWDIGLCEESDEQVSMLRRMRFKIATKILLHEFNVHAEKMFDLAFKFESENDEQTSILIIVNAIKNRDERDPAKTKSFVENQEEDELKNK